MAAGEVGAGPICPEAESAAIQNNDRTTTQLMHFFMRSLFLSDVCIRVSEAAALLLWVSSLRLVQAFPTSDWGALLCTASSGVRANRRRRAASRCGRNGTGSLRVCR